jgi:hypothetical protein
VEILFGLKMMEIIDMSFLRFHPETMSSQFEYLIARQIP